MAKISFLHTAAVHEPTFRGLMADLAPDMAQRHTARPDWLDEARQTGVSADLHRAVAGFLTEQAQEADAVLCTCSTLGPIADGLAAAYPNILRIDRPLMARAAAEAGTGLVALCLDSTKAATLQLVDEAFREAGREPDRGLVLCADAWLHFEAGDMASFAQAIAERVRAAVQEAPDPGCVILAQASMACAAPLLSDLPVPVFSSPRLAVEAAVRAAM